MLEFSDSKRTYLNDLICRICNVKEIDLFCKCGNVFCYKCISEHKECHIFELNKFDYLEATFNKQRDNFNCFKEEVLNLQIDVQEKKMSIKGKLIDYIERIFDTYIPEIEFMKYLSNPSAEEKIKMLSFPSGAIQNIINLNEQKQKLNCLEKTLFQELKLLFEKYSIPNQLIVNERTSGIISNSYSQEMNSSQIENSKIKIDTYEINEELNSYLPSQINRLDLSYTEEVEVGATFIQEKSIIFNDLDKSFIEIKKNGYLPSIKKESVLDPIQITCGNCGTKSFIMNKEIEWWTKHQLCTTCLKNNKLLSKLK